MPDNNDTGNGEGTSAPVVSTRGNDQVVARKLKKVAKQAGGMSFSTRVGATSMGLGRGDVIQSGGFNFFSPQLSTDFLELPQSLREKREWFRFYYDCLTPGTPVLMEDQTEKPIEDVKEGDRIINALGEATTVNRVFHGPMEDYVYRVKIEGVQEPIIATKQHPFYVFTEEHARCQPVGTGMCYPGQRGICSDTGHGYVNCVKKHDDTIGDPTFVHAQDLKVDSYALLPVVQTVSETSLDEDQMRLLGYYCAEGSLLETGVRLSLHEDEVDTIGKECFQVAEKFGCGPSNFGVYQTYKDRPSKGVDLHYRSCPDLRDLCLEHVGQGPKDKRLSRDIMEASPCLQATFLGAYLSGDGHYHEQSGIVAVTASYALATQLRGLALRLGMVATIFKDTKTSWRVTIPRYACEAILPYTNFQVQYRQRRFHSPRFRMEDRWMMHRITSIERVPYKGYICNLNVEGEGDQNSFIGGGVASHNTDPMVGQAIDLLTEIPLSKVRLSRPKCEDKDLADKSHAFFEQMCSRLRLFKKLLEITHLYWLDGNVFIFAEDDEREGDDYQGWTKLVILEADQVKVEGGSFTDEVELEFIPTDEDRRTVRNMDTDPLARKRSEKMPQEIIQRIREGQNLPLDTDPSTGSFCYHLARTRRPRAQLGTSILERCLLPGTLVTVKRNGIIQVVPVEEVNTDTDLLLTHKGRFRKAIKGSRPVSEMVTVLDVEGIDKPIALTSDHRMLRLKDGNEHWIECGELQSGDILRESHVVPERDPVTSIDFAEYWEGSVLTVDKLNRPNLRSHDNPTRDVTVIDAESDGCGLSVTFEYDQDDADQIDMVRCKQALVSWLKSLKEPVETSRKAISAVTGLTPREITVVAHELRKDIDLGTETRSLGRGGGRVTTWYPLPRDVETPRSKVRRTEDSSVTSIKVDEDFCYLLGTWLGDGDVWTSESWFLNTGSLGWTFDKKEIRFRERILDLVSSVFGDVPISFGNPLAKYDETSNTDCIKIEDPLLSRWFVDQFGKGCDGKRLPDWFFDLSEDCILALLRGVLDTDGCLRAHSPNFFMIDVQLKNKTLIDQLHLLCNRVGLNTRTREFKRSPFKWDRKWKTKAGWKGKTYEYGERTYWGLVSTRSTDVKRWAEGTLKGSDIDWPTVNSWQSQFADGWFQRKVKKVETVHYEGPVYSFDVAEDESLTLHQLCAHNCLRVLLFRDKLRQAQTSVASRHMTPHRVVWGEGLDEVQVDELREQVDLTLMDPDFSIVTNYQVNWEEFGVNDRLLDLSNEYDITDRQLMIGLGVTMELLTGEGTYTGNRLSLEVMNTRFLLFREILQEYVEEFLFKPIAIKKGFVETDKWGYEHAVYPKLGFNRLALRDNQDTFDALFNLYQKGSLTIDFILDLFNIDAADVEEKLKRDFGTMNDAMFNEIIRGAFGDLGSKLAEETDLLQRVIEHLDLKHTPPAEEGRFG